MRSRLVLLVAVVIAAAAVVLAVARVRAFSAGPSHPGAVDYSLASPRRASFLGVYETGTPRSYQGVTQFAKAAGRQPNLVGYYSGWGQGFETSFARTVSRHGAVTILQWDPTDASISGIAAGRYDHYLRSFADSVRDFGRPVVIGFGHEMNARWYSWGYGHVPPPTFVAAWRHIVTLFRGQGADNVTWLWTINADRPGTGPVAAWWPGPRYVDWVGIDGYYYSQSDDFASVFGQTIGQVRGITRKPVLLSETAVGPAAGQFAKISNLFAGMHQYQTIGLVWFDIAQHDGPYHQDWRIEDSPAAEAAFRLGASSLTLARSLSG
jgi:Glycosyl hydrolase family 26